MKKNLVNLKKSGIGIVFSVGIEKYLQSPALWFAEVATGVLTYGKKDLLLAGGQIIQGAIKLDLWGEFLHQLKIAREKGKTKDKFYESRNGRINFNELFSYLDKNDTPDAEVFKAMQAIFLASIKMDTQQKDEILSYELLQVCKKLKSIDLLVLLAAFELYQKQQRGEFVNVNSIQSWQIKVSESIGLPIDLVVQSRIQFSGNERATSPFLYAVENSTVPMPNMGLNALSIALGTFITKGNELIKQDPLNTNSSPLT